LIRSTAKTNAFTMPVVVLVNRDTTGAAEALAALLREGKSALVLGATTAGQVGNYKEFTLTNGQRLRVATGEISLGEDRVLSTSGLKPDIAVKVGRDEEKAWFEDPFKSLARPALANASTNRSTNALGSMFPRRRLNEAELVRMQREGIEEDDEEPVLTATPTEPPPGKPVLRDPVLGRALDLLRGLAMVQKARPQ
jgi:C-terminal processing protease CtpA/Prc